MGLIEKFKKMFIEDEDDEKEVKIEYTQEIKIEETSMGDTKEVTISERELYKSPSTFKFPVIFEEEDLKPSNEERKHYTFDRSKEKAKEKEAEEKKFISSPIISPIYGILDKNYKKEEITNKSEHPDYVSSRNHNINIDTIRQKAFGTLEEDMEQTILEDRGFIYGLEEEEVKEDPIAEEMGLNGKAVADVSIAEAYENYSDYGVEYKAEVTVEEEEPLQKTEVLEEDLFELINLMHKKEEEEEAK